MAVTNNLKPQVDTPVWEWCRQLPTASTSYSSTCSAKNSLLHVTFGRYIYFMQALAMTTGNALSTGFFRYDTISDSYQELNQPPFTTVTYSSMEFTEDHGYAGYVLGNGGGPNTLQIAGMTGQTLKGFEIRIVDGTGNGQMRTITGVSDPVIWDVGTITAVAATPTTNITDSSKNWAWNQWAGYQVRFVSSAGQSQVRKILYNSATELFFADVAKYAEDQWAEAPIVTVANSALLIPAAASSVYHIESSVITVDSNWMTTPDTTSRFIIRSGGIWLLSSGTTTILQYYDVLADTWYLRNGASATSPLTAAGTDASIINTGESATIWERGTASSGSSTTLVDSTKNWIAGSGTSGANQWVGYYVRIWSGTGEDQYRLITANTSNTLTVATWSNSITPDSTSRYFIEGDDNGTFTGTGAMTQTGASTGTIIGNVFTAGSTTGYYCPGQILTGTGVLATTTVISPFGACNTNGAVTTIYFAWGNPVSLGITTGMAVSLSSINAGTGTLAAVTTGPTYVTAVTAPSGSTPGNITVSNAVATQLVGVTLQFTNAWFSGAATAAHTNAGTTITLSGGNGTTGLYPGMLLTVGTGTGTFAAQTYVTQIINATMFQVSATMTANFAGSTWIQGTPISQTTITAQLSGVPGGAGTYTVFPSQQVASTTITGTGVGTVTDTTKDWLEERWNNYAIRIKSGTGKGQVRAIVRTVSSGGVEYTSASGATNVGALITVGSTTNLAVNDILNVTAGTGAFAFGTYVVSVSSSTQFIASAPPTTNLSASAVVTAYSIDTLVVSPAWTTQPDTTSTYVIHGNSDNLYISESGLTPLFIQSVDADIVTTGRVVERGVARGAAAQMGTQEAHAISTATPPVSVLNITSGYGYIAGVNVTSGSWTSNIATLGYTTTAAMSTLQVGSWISVASVLPAGYNGTWQVTNSSPGSVSFYVPGTTPGAWSSGGTIGQANSYNLQLGSTIDTGTWTQFGAATTWNGSVTIAAGLGTATTASYGGYQSAALTASSSSTTVTLASGTNVGLVVGQIPTVIAGTGTFAAGTIVASLISTNQFTVNIAPSVALSSATVAVNPSFATSSTTAVGTLTTLGVVQKTPQAPTAFSGSGTVVTVTTSKSVFPVGSWVVISGVTPGTYNGTYQVTGGTAGTNFTFASPMSTAVTVLGTVGIATYAQMLSTVNSYRFQNGQSITVTGDQSATASAANTSGAITLMVPAAATTPATQFVLPTTATAGPVIVSTQSTSLLVDGNKNWVPNQWAGCSVTYNTTQITNAAAPTQPTILTAHIIANTATTLFFGAAHTTAPQPGISRYVITASFTALSGNMLGALDQGLTQTAVAVTTTVTDVTKAWIMPAVITGITATTITVGSATAVISGSMNSITIGMVAVITVGTVTLPSGAYVIGISGTTLTFSSNFGGSGNSATITFAPVASSSGNTVTVYGYPMCGLAVGMKLAVTSTGTALASNVYSTGSLLQNTGTNFTLVTVTNIASVITNGSGFVVGGTFTISSTPVVPLLNATLNASFWITNQWINRRFRMISGISFNNSEAVITSSTFNSFTFASIGTPTSATAAQSYAIFKQPVVRGTGTDLLWTFGTSNLNTRGRYIYQARGGALAGFDRLDFMTDDWKFLTTTPGIEVLTQGSMYAYDQGDRIYFTVNVTQRVYYLDIDNNIIHPAGLYPYTAGAAIYGNRMEVYTTVDKLKYLWLNRHTAVECFKQLLFY
jgi:hypothetical protein